MLNNMYCWGCQCCQAVLLKERAKHDSTQSWIQRAMMRYAYGNTRTHCQHNDKLSLGRLQAKAFWTQGTSRCTSLKHRHAGQCRRNFVCAKHTRDGSTLTIKELWRVFTFCKHRCLSLVANKAESDACMCQASPEKQEAGCFAGCSSHQGIIAQKGSKQLLASRSPYKTQWLSTFTRCSECSFQHVSFAVLFIIDSSHL